MARRDHFASQGFEDVSSYSSSKEYKKRKKNRRGRAVLRGIAVFFCLVFILCGSGLVYVSTNLLANLTTTSIAKDNDSLGIDTEISSWTAALKTSPCLAACSTAHTSVLYIWSRPRMASTKAGYLRT